MKQVYHFLFVFLLISSLPALSQSEEQMRQVSLDKAAIADEWFDPAFPVPCNSESILTYSADLEAYVKEHPAFPVLIIANPTPEQIVAYNAMVDEWMQINGNYFPRFIEYSKYNKLLTKADDYAIYFAAREEWVRRNPDKAGILEEEMGFWITSHPKEYNAIVNSNKKEDVK